MAATTVDGFEGKYSQIVLIVSLLASSMFPRIWRIRSEVYTIMVRCVQPLTSGEPQRIRLIFQYHVKTRLVDSSWKLC